MKFSEQRDKGRYPEELETFRKTKTGLEGFWSWAKERFMKHHGVSRERFPLYLKELAFRYNNLNGDLFNQVANYPCDLLPKRD